MPDGTILRNVPEGVTQRDLTDRYQQFLNENPVSSLPPRMEDLASEAATQGREAVNWVAGGTPEGADYITGLPAYDLRRELAIRDNPMEREALLNQTLGSGNWYKDAKGNEIVRPAGIQALGFDPGKYGNRDVALDESWLSGPSMADLEEFSAQAMVPTLGGVLGGILGLPLGPLGSAAGAGIGAMGARGFQEAWENWTGRNQQPAGQVGMDLTAEGIMNTLPAEVGRTALGAVGGKIAAPYASRIPEANAQVLREAKSMGVRPTMTQVVETPGLVARSMGIAKNIFPYSRREQRNIQNIHRELANILDDLPPEQARAEAGETIKAALETSKREFQNWGRELYAPLKKRVGGTDVPVVPTGGLKKTAEEIMGSLPPTIKGGKEVPMTLGSVENTYLSDFANFPEQLTLDQVWALRTRLRDMKAYPSMNPGIPDKNLDKLYQATSEALKSIPKHGKLAGALNRIYEKAVKERSSALIDQILRNPGDPGSIPPEAVVNRIFKRDSGSLIGRFMKQVPEEYRPKVQRAALSEVLEKVADGGDIQDVITSGPKLLKVLRSYGPDTLRAMFGEKKTSQLMKLGRVMEVNSRRYKDYGQLVAAAIAARPMKNLGRIAQFRVLRNVFESPTGIDWLIEGLDFQSPAGQAAKTLGETLNYFTTYGAAGAGEGAAEDGNATIDWLTTQTPQVP